MLKELLIKILLHKLNCFKEFLIKSQDIHQPQ